ncbi:MAG: hypothetical protein KIH69_009085 [Anaerolineae bacterium]|nr:hypothetical protein [Anaerolineae bacterium]
MTRNPKTFTFTIAAAVMAALTACTALAVGPSRTSPANPFPPAKPAQAQPPNSARATGETWVRQGIAIGAQVGNETQNVILMPHIVKLDTGDARGAYRMFYNKTLGPGQDQISYADSNDGVAWQAKGVALQGSNDPTNRTYVLGGAQIVRLNDGRWRMYYRASPKINQGTPPAYGIFSAISNDGNTFTNEPGVRIDIQPYAADSPFVLAGHGAFFVANDGTYGGIFSGNLASEAKSPSSLYLIFSKDGLTWDVKGAKRILKDYHDPTVVKYNGQYVMYAMNLHFYTAKVVSADGLNWGATPEPINLLDEQGKTLDTGAIGDVGGMVAPNGELWLFSNHQQGQNPSMAIARWRKQAESGQSGPSQVMLPTLHAPPVQALVPTPTPQSGNPSGANEFTPCSGYANPPGSPPPTGNVFGPWASRLMTALSDDGINFTRTNRILSDQADVPDAITLENGETRVYYITWCPDAVRNKIVMASTRDGLTWTYRKVTLNGVTGTEAFAVDPTVERVVGENGSPSGYRLYFTSSVTQNQPNQRMPGQSYSAFSTDGITFTFEPGVRFGISGQDVLDPNVLRIGSVWHYFAGGMGGNYHAISTDGLTFTRTSNFDQDNILLANGLAVGDGYRYYGFVQSMGGLAYIRSLHTTDGVTWRTDAGNRLMLDESNGLEAIGVKDPAVTRLANGKYLMVYSTIIPEYLKRR